MFDDANKEPEDIFADTDQSAPQVPSPTKTPSPPAPPVPAPVPEAPVGPVLPVPEPTVQTMPETSGVEGRIAELQTSGGGIPWKPIVIVLAIIVVVGGAFLISMKILTSSTPTTPQPPAELSTIAEEMDDLDNVGMDDEPIIEPEEIKEEDPVVSSADSDKDGLTDVEEEELGTSSKSEDTDDDGLFDFEEVYTWGTDPLNPDTDGDGFTDGAEVSNGYDPNGEGSPLTIPEVE